MKAILNGAEDSNVKVISMGAGVAGLAQNRFQTLNRIFWDLLLMCVFEKHLLEWTIDKNPLNGRFGIFN